MQISSRALVSGGTGFIGRNLVARLVEAGFDVTCVLRHSSVVPKFPAAAARAIKSARVIRVANISELTASSLGRFDFVFHLAAAGIAPSERDPGLLESVNVEGPRQMASLADAVGARLILAGSSAEYADPVDGERLSETAPLQKERLYGRTKVEGTQSALKLAATRDVPAVCCRLFNIFGPGEAAHRLFPSAVRAFSKGTRLPLSTGTQIRDFLSVSDACSAMLELAKWLSRQTDGSENSAVNICTGEGRSVLAFAMSICNVMDGDEQLLGIGDLPLRADDVPILVGDPNLLAMRTGWRASPHQIALAAEIEAFRRGIG